MRRFTGARRTVARPRRALHGAAEPGGIVNYTYKRPQAQAAYTIVGRTDSRVVRVHGRHDRPAEPGRYAAVPAGRQLHAHGGRPGSHLPGSPRAYWQR